MTDLSLTSKLNTTCLIYDNEIQQFYCLLDHGISITMMIELCFRNHEAILKQLQQGKPLSEIFLFKNKRFNQYFKFYSSFLSIKDSLKNTFYMVENSDGLIQDCFKKMIYPLFIFIFCFVMILFLNDAILPYMEFMNTNQSDVNVLFIMKYIFYLIFFFLIVLSSLCLILYKTNSLSILIKKSQFMKMIVTHQFSFLLANVIDTGLTTKTCFEYLHTLNSSFIRLISEDIFNGLKKGQNIISILNENEFLDKDFIKYFQTGSLNASLSELLKVYAQQTSLKIKRIIQKATTGIQIFSYACVGMIAIYVYQVRLYPLNMLSGM